jgi:hypothetical protein
LRLLFVVVQDVHREAQREAANVARRDERGGRGGPPDRMGGRDRGGPGSYGGGPPGNLLRNILMACFNVMLPCLCCLCFTRIHLFAATAGMHM